jgi:hypothetical protein
VKQFAAAVFLFARYCSEIVEQFIVEPSEPQGSVGRFDLGENVCFFRYVRLRSQSLAGPTLRYRALSGRRAGYQWHAAVRMAAKRCGKSCVFLAGSFRNCAAEPGAGAKTRLRRRGGLPNEGGGA